MTTVFDVPFFSPLMLLLFKSQLDVIQAEKPIQCVSQPCAHVSFVDLLAKVELAFGPNGRHDFALLLTSSP